MQKKGPETITIRGHKVPEWFVNDSGVRFEYDSMAVLDKNGGFDLSQLEDGQCVLAPGVIYNRVAT